MSIIVTLDRTKRIMAILIFLSMMVTSLVVLFFLPPILQNQSYHRFADQRALLGIPNVWNVTSNLAFVAVGAAGLARWRADAVAVVIFFGILLTGFGSAYYHWSPNDGTLFWDRLPMTIVFMAILAGAVKERVDDKMGLALLWPLLAIGVLSVLLWRWNGDLRLYGWVQFFSALAFPLIVFLLPPRFTGTSYWMVAIGLYAVAKVLEHFDGLIYSTGHFVSGHTLKHLTAAAASFVILRYFQMRRPI